MESSQVFVSYDHRDYDWVSGTLLPKLSKAGFEVRHDSQIHLGTSIYEWIDRSRNECRAFILVISRNYVQNRSYARAEMEDLVIRGLKGLLRVVPVFKEALDDGEVPFGLLSLDSIRTLETLDSRLAALAIQLKGGRTTGLGGTATIHHFVPPERRIRIQASTLCTQTCPWCHWDDFPRTVEAPNYLRVLELMKGLRDAGHSDKVTYPRPNIGFALTGGEPLTNRGEATHGVGWDTLASVDPQNTFLLTNGRLLDEEVISIIRAVGLKHIRIDLPLIPQHDFRGIRPLPAYGSIGEYYDIVLDRVGNLLDKAQVEVRFNYVVEDSAVEQIDDYLNFLRTRFGRHIGNGIKGIAFIEQNPRCDPSIDIFDLASNWASAVGLTLNTNPLVQRKTTARTRDELLIEFIKLNCAATGDLISRCFACVQEQDIAISADGRIRICSGWDSEREYACRHVFAHFETSQPLIGISGAIRRRYGLVGFYSHFAAISKVISGMPIPPFLQKAAYQFAPNSFKDFVGSCGIQLSDNSLRDFSFIRTLAEKTLDEQTLFPRLYEEGTYDQTHLDNSTRLCCHLLRAAYELASRLATPTPNSTHVKVSLNGILLLLEYLCVDENLFSTGRTLMVQGMSTDILKRVVKNGVSGNFLSDSSYCLSAVAFENCDAEIVLQFLLSQVPTEEIQNVAWVQYLIGCLHRQSGRGDEAITALELAYFLADTQIQGGSVSPLMWLLREVRAEAKRSLGAIRKRRPEDYEQSQEDFLQANFLASVDNTALRYAALFSDGYASMLQFFRNELGTAAFPKEAYKAHRDFSESLSLNPTFYASLIRMGLLELALGHADVATERLKRARRSFSNRGLLTDQEYLNSILCDLIYVVADEHAFLYSNRPQVWSLGIADCKNVGKRDVLCVKEDAEFLLAYLSKACAPTRRNKLQEIGVISEVEVFVKHCAQLAGAP